MAPDLKLPGRSPADALADSYIAWREASHRVQAAYERWGAQNSRDREAAFGGYMAALQQEGHAARAFQRQLERARVPFGGGP